MAAVFAVHPLHVESVAWIAERRDVLSGLFFMLTLGAYAGYVRHPQSLGRYLMVVLMLALALMSKPMVVTLPFVLLLLDYWPLRRFSQPGGRLIPWRLIAEKLPLLALSGAACVATFFAQKEAIASLPLSVRIGNALVSYVAYLGQMIYPVGLAVYYPHPGNGLALWKIYRGLCPVAGHLHRCPCHPAETALVFDRLVVVFGDVGSGNRVDSVGDAGAGGPLHLSAADWPVYSSDLDGG